MVKLLYFSWMREHIGCTEEERPLPQDVATVADMIAHLRSLGGGYARAFERENLIRAAIGQQYVKLDHAIEDGDELALFPPVTGG